MQRTLSMLLLCALLLSAVACSSKKPDDAGDNTANGTDTASETETETEDPFDPHLPEMDFGGENFTFAMSPRRITHISSLWTL